MNGICPCCGQQVTDDSALLVSLDTNHVSRSGITIRLTPQQAEIAYILRSGRVVRHGAIFARLYGARDEPASAPGMIKVHMTHLRKALAPLGVSIENIRAVGYRMVFDGVREDERSLDGYLYGLAAIRKAAA